MMEWKGLLPLCLLVLGIITLFITVRSKISFSMKNRSKKWEMFLKEELDATFIRKQDISPELFITIDLETIPLVENIECTRVYNEVVRLSGLKMINLKGITNLDLKKRYGVSHLDNLINYERNYLSFIDILIKYGTILYEKDFIQEAREILELTISYGCDSSKAYLLLGELYAKDENQAALKGLILLAQKNMQGSYYLDKVLNQIEMFLTQGYE